MSILGIFTGLAKINATVAVMKEVTLLGGITYGRPGSRSDFDVALEIAAKPPTARARTSKSAAPTKSRRRR